MNDRIAKPTRSRRFQRVLFALLAIVALLGAVPTASAHQRGPSLWDAARATAKYHRLDRALADGYGVFYTCTDNNTPGVGAMGQHYANVDLVFGDPALDPLRPEVLVYEPMPNGHSRLVAVEYVVMQADWHAAFGDRKPRLFGQELEPMGADNRYGLPPFYELHVWLWKYNPSGLFSDWNPRVSCHGNGDPA